MIPCLPIKLSPQQKRRRRAEQNAVRKALLHTAGLRNEVSVNFPDMQPSLMKAPPGSSCHRDRIDRLTEMVDKLDAMVGEVRFILMHGSNYKSSEIHDGVSFNQGDLLNQQDNQWECLQSFLNPSAEAFVPANHKVDPICH